jgi:hypothetical protein
MWQPYSVDLLPREMANVVGWLRDHQHYEIYQGDIERLLTLPTPTVKERADKLLQAIAQQIDELGKNVAINQDNELDMLLMAKSYCVSPGELAFLARQFLAENKTYLKAFTTPAKPFEACVTASGYAYLDDLLHSPSQSTIGFCAMWFNEGLRPVWDEGISPAIESAGYKPLRIDRVEHNNKIDDEIIANIRRSKFVVADFTGNRGGVYFEAGFSRGLNKEVIWTTVSSPVK